MTRLTFDTEWHDGETIRGPELSATFASLRIDVGGQVVTRLLDQRAQTVRDSVYVPLYPLAEWLVANWWFLTYESDNPAREGDRAFGRRHALGTNTEGYAFPDLAVVSSGTRTDISWGSEASPWSKVDFLNRGHASVETDEFRDACADLIDRVIRRLMDFGIQDTFLHEEWTAIQSADSEEVSFCETAAGLGWDPYDLDESKKGQVFRLAQELGPLSSEALPVIDGSNPLEDSSAIVAALEAARDNSLQLQSLGALIGRRNSLAEYPWEIGYDLAKQARERLGLDGQPIRSMKSLADALDVRFEALEQVTQPLATLESLGLVDGVVTGRSDATISLGLRKKGEHGLRFAFCRAIAEAISSDGDALLTRGRTDRQRSNRAFAAEFLAPAAALEQRLSGSMVGPEEVEELAEEFGVSTLVVTHQLENQRIARVADT